MASVDGEPQEAGKEEEKEPEHEQIQEQVAEKEQGEKEQEKQEQEQEQGQGQEQEQEQGQGQKQGQKQEQDQGQEQRQEQEQKQEQEQGQKQGQEQGQKQRQKQEPEGEQEKKKQQEEEEEEEEEEEQEQEQEQEQEEEEEELEEEEGEKKEEEREQEGEREEMASRPSLPLPLLLLPAPLPSPPPPPPLPPPPAAPSKTMSLQPPRSLQASRQSAKKPPGTWTPAETFHLINTYQEKWYALKRGQLRTLQWDEVSEKLGSLCQGLPDITPKTSMQCRHKVEKLRRRYRAERQLALRKGARRGAEAWPFFEQMDRMEQGVSSAAPLLPQNQQSLSHSQKRSRNQSQHPQFLPDPGLVRRGSSHPAAPAAQENAVNESTTISLDEDAEEEEEDSDQPPPHVFSTRKRRRHQQQNSYTTHKEDRPADSSAKTMTTKKKKLKPIHGGSSSGSSLKREKIQEGSPVNPNHPSIPPWYLGEHPEVQQASELAYLVRALGENFLRMEQMKIQMQRENELFRADMELRRTEMVIESQRQIADLFSQAMISMKRKKMKERKEADEDDDDEEEENLATG